MPTNSLIPLRWLLALSLICAVTISAPALAKTPALVVIGDSLSAGYGMRAEQGWVHLLSERLRERAAPYQVVNASISGDTSRGGSARLGILLKKFDISIAIVELGGNDGLRGIDLAQTRKHLGDIITRLQAAGAKVLLLGMQIPPNLGPRYTTAFKELYPALARTHTTALVPFFLTDVAAHGDLMQSDGIHPTAAAQPQLLDNVWPYLQPLL
tara:strand:+ start:1601 stop:2236 length:636 start_codon:yes stop_codon:yes gene_type:complete